MLKLRIDRKKDYVRVKAKGKLQEITTETQMAVKMVFLSLHEQNPAIADEFRRNMIAAMIDPNSPIFKIPEE